MTFQEVLQFEVFSFSDDKIIRVINLIMFVLVIFFARLIAILGTRLIAKIVEKRKLDSGTKHSFSQLYKYFVFIVASVMALNSLGFNIQILLGAGAALLVGIGLGLQQTFNDLISGVILLFEQSVEVGDVVNLNGTVGRVKHIGMRTSRVIARDNSVLIVPNSQLIVSRVENWSYNDDKVRFSIEVGVAYGTDSSEVRDLLLEIVGRHGKVLKSPKPFVRFENFGDSALLFSVYFWSREFIAIEDVQSDLRFAIDKRFKERNISIPFPQRDVWLKREV